MIAGARAAATIGNAIGTCGVPSHTDHQATVVTPVGRPPVLTVGHQCGQVALKRIDIQRLQRFAVVEGFVQWISLAVVLMQDVEVERIGPPGHHRVATGSIRAVHDGAGA